MWMWMWMYVDVSGRRAVAVWRWSFEDLDGDLSRRPSWVARPQPNVTRPSPRPSPLSLPPSRIRISTRSLRRLAHGHARSPSWKCLFLCCILVLYFFYDFHPRLDCRSPLPPSAAVVHPRPYGTVTARRSPCTIFRHPHILSMANKTQTVLWQLDIALTTRHGQSCCPLPPSPFRQAPASLDLAPYCAGNSHTR
jgi:hypothetical protein